MKHPRFTALLLMFGLVAACGPTAPKQVRLTPPPTMPVIDPHVAPIAMPVGSILQPNPGSDPVGLSIVEARMGFEHGQDLYAQGFMNRAKEEFDRSIDVLLESASIHTNNDRLENELTDLVGKIHTLELSAFKDGDGFSDQNGEHAAIDDVEHIETFPSSINPKLKSTVEEEVAEVPHDLPIEINDRVLEFLDYYQNGKGRTFIEIGLERASKYRPMIERILKEEGVPLDLIYLCEAESAFAPRAVSRAQAKGMWQFVSARGKEYGLRQTWWIDERSDPEKSTRAAARHLKDLYAEFGDWYLAMAAYNSGPMRVQRALDKNGAVDYWQLADKKALPKETLNYVPIILALTIIGKNPEKYGFTVEPSAPLETDRVRVDKATDLRVIAEAIHVPVEQLRDLNPHVLRWTTPPDDPEFELNLPKGYGDAFREQIASMPESDRVLFRYHTVGKGETLSTVAKKYAISSTVLAQANNVTAKKPLRVGQELIIPLSGATPPSSVASASTAKGRTVKAGATYTVKRGDTLAKIAARYNVTTEKLRSWNNMSSSKLAIGKKLVVSAAQATATVQTAASVSSPANAVVHIHKVQPGETLNKIAMTYKTTVDAILSWNKKNDLSVLHPGEQITILLDKNRPE